MDPSQPQFKLEHRLCLNGLPLPLQTAKMDLEDLHKVAGGDQEDQDFVLLSIKASGEVHWLEKALNVRARFWRTNHAHIPLMQEMSKAIDDGKVRKGARGRLSRMVQAVVGIKVRNKVVLVQNKSGLVLAFRPGEEMETIRWFLEEVSKDLKRLEEVGRACGDGPRKKGGGHRVPLDDPDPAQAFIDTTLSKIKAHPQCHLVTYMPSRICFHVIKKGEKDDVQNFYLHGYQKKRKVLLDQVSQVDGEQRQDDRAEEAVRIVFEQTLNVCIEYLDKATGSQSELPVPLEG